MQLPRHLFLVRHGEILDQAARAVLAQIQAGCAVPGVKLAHGITPDYGLTEFGVKQVHEISRWLREVSPATFEEADDRRKHQFWVPEYHPENSRCHATNEVLGFPPHVWKESELLKDRDWGTAGYSVVRDDLRKLHKAAPSPYYWRPSGDGTSMCTLVERARSFLSTLQQENPLETVVVSCHGEVLIALTVVIRQLSPGEFNSLLREGHFDMPAAVISHFSRTRDDSLVNSDDYCRERLVCPWEPKHSRFGGAWTFIN